MLQPEGANLVVAQIDLLDNLVAGDEVANFNGGVIVNVVALEVENSNLVQ